MMSLELHNMWLMGSCMKVVCCYQSLQVLCHHIMISNEVHELEELVESVVNPCLFGV